MKTLITLICVSFSISIFAQPSLSEAWLPEVGDSYTIRAVELDTIDPGFAGIDIVWDFRNIPGTDNDSFDVKFLYIDKNDTPFADSYPEATIALTAADFGFNIYQGLTTEGTFVDYGNNFSGFVETIYTTPQTIVPIPFEYLDETTDPFEGTSVQVNTTYFKEGTIMVQIDGYGDVILPDGKTYENVLRIKVIEMSSDSANLGAGLREKLLNNVETYVWTSDEYPVPLATMSFTQTTQVGYFDGIPNDSLKLEDEYDFAFTVDITSGTKNIVSADKINLSLQPNPTSGQSILSAELTKGQEMNIAVYDMQGRKMMSQKAVGQIGQNNWPVNATALSNGLYVARLSGADFESSVKFVKK